MTQTQNSTSTRTEVPSEKLNLSATQIIASGLAAVSSTVALSYFGVAGTVIGAAVGAIVTVTGNAVYGYSLRRTRNRVLDLAVAQRFNSTRTVAVSADPEAAFRTSHDTPRPARPPLRWHPKRLAIAAAGLFVVIMAATTAFELASGQPLSSTVTGNHGSGTSFGGTESKPARPSPVLSPTSKATTDSPSDPSPTVTVTVTPSSSGTPSATPTPSDTGSGTASTPTGSGTPSSAPTPTPTPSG